MKSSSNVSANAQVKGSKRAYSLIEVMIGMFILSLVLLACISALPQMRKMSYRSDAARMGFTHLNAAIESLRTQTFSQMDDEISGTTNSFDNEKFLNDLLDRPSGGFGTKTSHSLDVVTQNGITYTVDAFLQHLDNDDKVIEATVVVRWDFQDESQFISSHAVFVENGLSDKKFSLAN